MNQKEHGRKQPWPDFWRC